MVGADVGEAVITGVKEFDKYGFLKGEMEKNEMPDIASFADWAWDNMEPNTIIRFINHPGRGKYLATEYGTYLKPCEDGFCPMYTSYDDKQYTEQQMSFVTSTSVLLLMERRPNPCWTKFQNEQICIYKVCGNELDF